MKITMDKIIRLIIAGSLLALAAAFLSARPAPVLAQDCEDCSTINDASDCDACGGDIFCVCDCDILCYWDDNCSCEATLCQWLEDGDPGNTAPDCADNCECVDWDEYNRCIECSSCVGTCASDKCQFNCPSWINPCVTVCSAVPTPAPTTLPGEPTPTAIPTLKDIEYPPACTITSGPAEVCVDQSVSYTFGIGDIDGNLSSAEAYKSLTTAEDLGLIGIIPNNGASLTTSFSSAGKNYVFCSAFDTLNNKCTANPWCPWEPIRWDDHSCDGWSDCNYAGLDWMQVDVYARPTPPVNTTTPGLYCDVSSVTLSWTAVPGAEYYPYRVDVAPDSWNLLNPCVAPDYCSSNTNTATSAVWPVTNCQSYETWVHAVDTVNPAACEWSSGSNSVYFWTDNTPQNAPTGIAPTTTVCDTTPTFTWNATADCNRNLRYLIGVDDWANGWSGSCIAPFPGDFCVIDVYGTSYTVGTRGEAPLIPGHTYAWWVHATTDCGTGPAAGASFQVLDAPIATNLTENLFCGYAGTAAADFSWIPDPLATAQSICIERIGDPAVCTGLPIATTSYSATLSLIVGQPTTDFRWWVTSTNICGSVPTIPRPFSISECRVSGTVRLDPFGVEAFLDGSGIFCTDSSGLTGVEPGVSANVKLSPPDGTYTSDVAADGTYSVAAPLGVYNASLFLDTANDGWTCTCPANCTYGSVTSPSSDVDFYVTQLQDEWVQTVIGDTHVDGSLGVAIPPTCSLADPVNPCDPHYALSDGVSSPGIVSYGASTALTTANVSTTGWLAGGTTYGGDDLSFDFWRREAGSVCTNLPDLVDRPSDPELDACSNNVFEITSASDLTLTGDWRNISQAVTLFVNFADAANPAFNPTDYNLILNPENGIMDNAGLLILITNGNIQVGDTVTELEGIYMADGTFRSCVTDGCGYDLLNSLPLQLKITGSVITWAKAGSGLDFQRDLFVANNYMPGELVTYEPKYLNRLPEFFERPDMTWKEIAP